MSLVIAWALGAAYYVSAPRRYVARVQLIISDNQVPSTFFNLRTSSGYEAILRYSRVLQTTLDSDPVFFKFFAERTGVSTDTQGFLKSSMSSRSVPGSLLLELSFSAGSATRAKEYLDAALLALGDTLASQNRALAEGLKPRILREIELLREEQKSTRTIASAQKVKSAEEAISLLELKQREMDAMVRNFVPPYTQVRAAEVPIQAAWPRIDVVAAISTLLGIFAYLLWSQFKEVFGIT